MRRAGKIVLLTSLYFSQGLPFGLFTQALPVLLRTRGASLPAVSLSSLLAAPWALKFLWAPLLDRPGARGAGRRRVLLGLQVVSALVPAALAFTPVGADLTPLFVGVVFANLCAATQDVATDALAIDLLGPDERGLGNGVQVAGYRLGMIVGGGALLAAFEYLGWPLTFGVVCALLLAATLPLLLAGAPALPAASPPALPYRAPPPGGPSPAAPEGAAEGFAAGEPGLAGFFRRPGVWAWLAFVASFKAFEALGAAMLRPFLVDRGFGLADIGWALGTVGASTSLGGALAGGLLVNRLGRRGALVAFGLAQSACLGAFALAALRGASGPTLVALCGLEHAAGGMATAALFTVMMDACRPESAATDYTVQACANVAANGAAAALSGFVAERAGYAAHFALAAAFGALAALFAGLLRPHRSWARWPGSGARREAPAGRGGEA
ncbi:MAG TPA: MFS transporter [Polyangiaceae bacterium]|nr:MFS transporter [Polyangiaceae bacterium]